jgi:XTP/dITP diphosphohydrolase
VPLLVVPLAADETDLLTLREWDALASCDRVLFERADHPLLERLRTAGVRAAPFDDEPDAAADVRGLLVVRGWPRAGERAGGGAEVSAGVASPPDALTAGHAAPSLRRTAACLADLAAVMARLRSDDGCPWDKEQTHESLQVHLLEEAHEVLETIDAGAEGEELAEELGDLLLQVAFHARLAEQDGRFDLSDVARRIVSKLIARHPHVFGERVVSSAQEVVANWEEIKSAEKGRTGPFEGIPRSLPALAAAYKTQKRAAALGFSATAEEARAWVLESLEREDVGEALFWLVAAARAAGADPEAALRRSLADFKASLAPPGQV